MIFLREETREQEQEEGDEKKMTNKANIGSRVGEWFSPLKVTPITYANNSRNQMIHAPNFNCYDPPYSHSSLICPPIPNTILKAAILSSSICMVQDIKLLRVL